MVLCNLPETLFALAEHLLGALALGDVAEEAHVAHPAINRHGDPVDIRIDNCAVLPETRNARGKRLVSADLGFELGHGPRQIILRDECRPRPSLSIPLRNIRASDMRRDSRT